MVFTEEEVLVAFFACGDIWGSNGSVCKASCRLGFDTTYTNKQLSSLFFYHEVRGT